MSGLTHAVYDALTGETKSEHPDASSAFAAASRIGGERYGYVVGPINCPPDVKKVVGEINEEIAEQDGFTLTGKAIRRAMGDKPDPKEPDQEGPGLFD